MWDIPERLRSQLDWTPVKVPIILLLGSGKDDAGSLDSCVHAYYPPLTPFVMGLSIRRDGGLRGQDIHQPKLYDYLCTMAAHGKILLVVGGPKRAY